MAELNEGQAIIVDGLRQWFIDWEAGKRIGNHPQWRAYSGAAGTGKTFTVKRFIDRMGFTEDEYICCAYVGKAVLNLQKQNLQAKTIHSLIYHTVITREEDPDEPGKFRLKMNFILKDKLDDNLRLIIVDEATMVNNDMRDKLLSFGLPIIFIGDMNQLPPIFGVSEVMLYPDFVLDKIMRTAEDDPIVQLSQMVLNEKPILPGNYGNCRVITEHPIDGSLLDDYDIILCGKNATRDRLNTIILRDLLHRKDSIPFVGAKVVNRQNDWDIMVDGISLTNGLIGYITDVRRGTAYRGYYSVDFRPDFMTKDFEDLKVDREYIRANYSQRKAFGMSRFEKFEYAYAITVHISQGSEFPRVLFIGESFWDREMTMKLWYTAITRATQQLTIVLNDPGKSQRDHWNEYNQYRPH